MFQVEQGDMGDPGRSVACAIAGRCGSRRQSTAGDEGSGVDHRHVAFRLSVPTHLRADDARVAKGQGASSLSCSRGRSPTPRVSGGEAYLAGTTRHASSLQGIRHSAACFRFDA